MIVTSGRFEHVVKSFSVAASVSRMCNLTLVVYTGVDEGSIGVADLQAGDANPQSNACGCCRHQQRPRLPVPTETAQLPS